jgi:plastocyanin
MTMRPMRAFASSNRDPFLRGSARLVTRVGALSCVLVGMSCGSDHLATQPTVNPDALYAALTLDRHAITLSTMAPYDTLKLTAVARNPARVPLADTATPTFTSGDAVRLSVGADGSLQALAPGTGIQVIATLQVNNVTHADTSYVDITDDPTPSPLASLSIHPVPPDSAKIAARSNIQKQLVARAQLTDLDSITGLQVDFRSTDPTIAAVDRFTGFVTGLRVGRVLIIATATAYGATRADTLPFAVGLPITYNVNVAPASVPNSTPPTTFTPSEIHVGVGATVIWVWALDMRPMDVAFDDSTRVAEDTVDYFGSRTGAGNIPPPDGCTASVPFATFFNCMKGRAFPEAGVYTYRSALTGAVGQVIVEAESAAGN